MPSVWSYRRCMGIYLSAYSSLTYLEREDALRQPVDVASLADAECSLHALMDRESCLQRLGCGRSPVHLLISSCRKRVVSDWFACSLWPHEVPPGSFVSPVRGVYVSTPEFCFLQMASRLSRIELVRLGYELCSTYRFDPSNSRGFAGRRVLTTRERLLGYLEGAGNAPQAQKAAGALAWVADGSASPRETITSMLVSLPSEMGGREVGMPHLNWEVPAGAGEDGPRRFIDLYWPDRRFGLEYDSDLEHADPKGMTRDSIREKEIELKGIRLARVTNAELKTEKGRDLLHKTICRGLGKRYVEPSERTAYSRRALASLLLAPHHSML